MRIKKIIESIKDYLLGMSMGGLIIMIIISVVGRTVWPHKLFFPQEIAMFCLLYITYIGSVVLSLKSEHIHLDYFYKKLATRYKQTLSIVHNLTSIVVFSIIFYYGIHFIIEFSYRTSDAARVPYFFFILPVLLCSFFMSIIGFIKIFRIVTRKQ